MTNPDSEAQIYSPEDVTTAWVTMAPKAESASFLINCNKEIWFCQALARIIKSDVLMYLSSQKVPNPDATPSNRARDPSSSWQRDRIDLQLVSVDVVDLTIENHGNCCKQDICRRHRLKMNKPVQKCNSCSRLSQFDRCWTWWRNSKSQQSAAEIEMNYTYCLLFL